MRIDPADEIIRAEEIKREKQTKIDKVTRIVAIVVAALSTYFFFIKILFL
ncbi:hypothetical protein MUY27_19050 [Mucilaginibacter sp. RS28]|uniref:Uncharacterized protein n=1 Tax=Mucilaginibacter straminoryzae TaxID=2932774 RepID=A0A9X1X7Y4_9SPHI|nr:hypothetical protein [Mucilaginibacter straminoryzae]MCJ8211825.1 hypothetical protein [Mucilaginibacter straminoryzae]